MIDLYYWTTPNGNKVLIFLEEAGLDYRIREVNIGRGDQFDPAFLAISPNNRIPAIVDHDPADGGEPLSIFESGAILVYLARKHGAFIPEGFRQMTVVLEWLMWQMGGVGPMFGQNHHFRLYTQEPVPYAVERYTNETTRLYNVLNRRLEGRDFVADEYSIADMAIYPWTLGHERQGQDIGDFPNVRAWLERIGSREAVVRAYGISERISEQHKALADDEEAHKHLYGQTDAKSPAAAG